MTPRIWSWAVMLFCIFHLPLRICLPRENYELAYYLPIGICLTQIHTPLLPNHDAWQIVRDLSIYLEKIQRLRSIYKTRFSVFRIYVIDIINQIGVDLTPSARCASAH
ncbi:hypothetical protein F5B20DRAFT_315089 [Whalleya microplaca]|nr:hypothetical protein F5B20DRAFT_315089 [Whalleya microplaca]